MIPELTGRGALPPGLHAASWSEVRRRFGSGRRQRTRLRRGLEAVLHLARRAGARRLYLGGSFVTDKKDPGDGDAILLFHALTGPGMPVLDLLADRPGIRRRHGGDLFTVLEEDVEVWTHYLEVFSHDREGRAKGLLRIELDGKGAAAWA